MLHNKSIITFQCQDIHIIIIQFLKHKVDLHGCSCFGIITACCKIYCACKTINKNTYIHTCMQINIYHAQKISPSPSRYKHIVFPSILACRCKMAGLSTECGQKNSTWQLWQCNQSFDVAHHFCFWIYPVDSSVRFLHNNTFHASISCQPGQNRKCAIKMQAGYFFAQAVFFHLNLSCQKCSYVGKGRIQGHFPLFWMKMFLLLKYIKRKKTFTKTAGSYESNDDLLHKKCCSIYKNVLFFHQNFRNMKL